VHSHKPPLLFKRIEIIADRPFRNFQGYGQLWNAQSWLFTQQFQKGLATSICSQNKCSLLNFVEFCYLPQIHDTYIVEICQV